MSRASDGGSRQDPAFEIIYLDPNDRYGGWATLTVRQPEEPTVEQAQQIVEARADTPETVRIDAVRRVDG